MAQVPIVDLLHSAEKPKQSLVPPLKLSWCYAWTSDRPQNVIILVPMDGCITTMYESATINKYCMSLTRPDYENENFIKIFSLPESNLESIKCGCTF